MAQRPGSGGSISSSTSGGTDTSQTKIFVGGLAWETECESMRRYFEQFGEIAEAVVIVDKHTGRSKGYGFVTFLEAEAARRACANPAPVIDGRRTNCNLAVLGAHRSRAGSPMFQGTRFIPYLNDYGVQAQQGAYGGLPNFRQHLPFAFHPYLPPHGYPAYPSEYYASPNMYNPYMGPSQQMTAAVYQSHMPPSPTLQHGHAQPPALQEQHQQLQGVPFTVPPSPVNLPSYFLPPPFIHSPGPVSPSGSQGASAPRFVLQAAPFTPGGGLERQSSS